MMFGLSDSDREFVEKSIGREPIGAQEVVARCDSGHPMVVRCSQYRFRQTFSDDVLARL